MDDYKAGKIAIAFFSEIIMRRYFDPSELIAMAEKIGYQEEEVKEFTEYIDDLNR